MDAVGDVKGYGRFCKAVLYQLLIPIGPQMHQLAKCRSTSTADQAVVI